MRSPRGRLECQAKLACGLTRSQLHVPDRPPSTPPPLSALASSNPLSSFQSDHHLRAFCWLGSQLLALPRTSASPGPSCPPRCPRRHRLPCQGWPLLLPAFTGARRSSASPLSPGRSSTCHRSSRPLLARRACRARSATTSVRLERSSSSPSSRRPLLFVLALAAARPTSSVRRGCMRPLAVSAISSIGRRPSLLRLAALTAVASDYWLWCSTLTALLYCLFLLGAPNRLADTSSVTYCSPPTGILVSSFSFEYFQANEVRLCSA